jgi:sugar lactone lactonase YvrE
MKKGLGAVFVPLFASGTLWAQQYLISTVAGGGGMPITPASALSVTLPPPGGVAVDASGNVYFSSGSFVFKLDTSGTLTTVAGTGKSGFSGDGGPATSARINLPQGVALDPAGNLYIADTYNDAIRKVTKATGVITTVAGIGGSFGYAGDGKAATSALLAGPSGVAVDQAGNLYIADTNNNAIREVAGGTILTIAGNTTAGYAGDNGPALQAELNAPQGVAVDTSGNLYIADTGNSVIRKVVLATGTITTFAGNGNQAYGGDGGAAAQAEINQPYDVAVDSAGNVYIADTSNYAVRKVTGGIITTVAGNGYPNYSGDGGPATSAQLDYPGAVAVDGAGDIYIADVANSRIRKVTAASGIITTVAGAGFWGYAGDGGPATQAELYEPSAVAVDTAGNLYIADTYNYAIRKVTPNGTITTVAGTGSYGYTGDGGPATSATLDVCYGVAVDAAGNLYIADTGNNAIREVSAATGIITTVAGNGYQSYYGDGGLATQAALDHPYGVAVDIAGNIYIADTGNNVVRGVAATNGYIYTVVGDGSGYPAYYGDGGPAQYAELDQPSALAFDGNGDLYIADTYNFAIREVVASSGNIYTVAGDHTGISGFGGDGGPATSARLGLPTGVAVDAQGSFYIADYYNLRVRKVTNGGITTVAGRGTGGYSGDGGAATQAELESPAGVAVDSAGNVYVAEDSNGIVRILVPENTHALLTVTSAHTGSFAAGSAGAFYSVLVSNTALAGATSGAVTVTEITPPGLTLVSMAGTGWNCSGATCSRSDTLAAGSSYPPITVTVTVAVNAPAVVVNEVAVSGGGTGSAAASASDPTSVTPVALGTPVLLSPANGATFVANAPVLSWNAASGAVSYEVYFGTAPAPPQVASTMATSYPAGTLTPFTTYYWQIVAQNGTASASSATWSFTTGSLTTGLEFVPVTPCRVADTRSADGPFGGPTPGANSVRSFPIPQSGCGIPSTAQAYSLNVTVVPEGPLSYLTLWPTGEAAPLVSTLNSFGGIVVANAAIVPAGTGGAVSVYVTNTTDVILDINGYFDTATGSNSYSFYPATPCRIADTRGPSGQFGGPSMFGGQTRNFPIPLSACGTPSPAAAYSLNVTVVPSTDYLGYLSTWPTGQPQPLVSTLNSWTGKVVANAAIVPAGSNGSISVFVTNPTDVILDTNGYFGAPGGTGALTFYPVTPCRVADTRGVPGPFGGPTMGTGETRSFTIPASGCSIPPTAAAYSLNVTVVPGGVLSYLSTWPTGQAQPLVSTLNSFDGSVVANAAIVPAGTGGAISVFVTNPTDVILDINGYFAP